MTWSDKQLDEIALSVINRLMKVVKEQQDTIKTYEGAIEGIKLFMQELRTKMNEQEKTDASSDKTSSAG